MRLLVRDTVESSPKLTDEAIKALLDQHGNSIYRSAALACELLGAGTAKSKSVGDLSISGLGETYLALAKRYRLLADSAVSPYAGGIAVSDKETRVADTDRVTPIFTRTMQSDVTLPASTGVSS